MAQDDIFLGRKDNYIDEQSVAWLRRLLENSHISILLGAGFSQRKLPLLEYREEWRTEADENMVATGEKKDFIDSVDAMFSAEYFNSIILPMKDLTVVSDQVEFLKCLKGIIERRGNVVVPRRVNLFTTNYDPLIEMALEGGGIEYNDGFSGRMNPVFDTASYSRIQTVQSLLLEYSQQVPTFNLIKMHGSVTWAIRDEQIVFSDSSDCIMNFSRTHRDVLQTKSCELISKLVKSCFASEEFDKLLRCLRGELATDGDLQNKLENLASSYRTAFPIVNPNKEKFKETVFDLNYYEMLRIFANELDRSGSLLLSFGFSFRDEHILEITRRALKNRNLQILVSCYNQQEAKFIHSKFLGEKKVRCIVSGDGEPLDLSRLTELLTRAAE